MIVTCPQCQTRFKVADATVANGPVRMRCSKCSHVFAAGADASPVVAPAAVPFPAVPAPPPDPFAAFSAAAPAARVDPFAGVPAPGPAAIRSATAAAPFVSVDAAFPSPVAPPAFAGPTMPSPFGAPAAAPFAAPAGPSPFAPAAGPSPFAAPTAPSPFAAPAAPPALSPFLGAPTAPTPFAAPPAPSAFAAPTAPAVVRPPAPPGDPFAALDDANARFRSDDDSAAALFGVSSTPAPPAAPPPSAPPPARVRATTAPPAPLPVPAPAASPTSAPPSIRRTQPPPSRAVRALKALLAAAQLTVFLVSLLVAVVLGRGGDVARLGSFDVRGALLLSPPPIAVDDVRITRRTTRAGDIVVVAGTVLNQTGRPLAGVRVDVKIGAQVFAASGWSAPDPLAVADVVTLDDVARLQRSRPKDASIAAGARAPFVVVAPAPVDGTPVSVAAYESAGSP